MKANDFLKVGEKYFYIYIPNMMLDDLYNVKFKIGVTSKTRIDEELGYVAFTIRFKDASEMHYSAMMYDTNVFGDHAFIEDGCYGTIITKYDKASARKALMRLAYKKMKRMPPTAEEKRTILRHNVKYLLKQLKKLKL